MPKWVSQGLATKRTFLFHFQVFFPEEVSWLPAKDILSTLCPWEVFQCWYESSQFHYSPIERTTSSEASCRCSVMAHGAYQRRNSGLTEKMETESDILLQLVSVGVIGPKCSFQFLISVHESFCCSFLPVAYLGQRLNTRHRENAPKSHVALHKVWLFV